MIARSEPATPAYSAESVNASVLWYASPTPNAVAAISLSRTARKERPSRLLSITHATRKRPSAIVQVR